ncbi:MAG: hypothetical protein OEP95_08100 [Myxococcales bacterium]|nr:hypothetical protein [Myxococcales bacterium]
MRRRFGRRRQRDQADDGRSPIDTSWLERIVSAGLVPVSALEPIEVDGIPNTLCRLGSGEPESGGRCIVSYSPHSASEALLGLVAALQRLPDVERGEAIAIAHHWDASDRRLLGALTATPLPVRALAAPGLGGAPVVGPERAARSLPEAPARVGLALPTAPERRLFARALAGLDGLAAKHGGAVRGAGGSVELVVYARRVAALQAGGQGASLEILEPSRAQHGLTEENLADVLDRLEGSVRKFLSDRRIRDSAAGSRARLAPFLARASGADWWALWPSAAAELEPVDFVGIEGDGAPILGVVSANLDLSALAAALRAVVAAESGLSELLRDAPAHARSQIPKLRIAASEVSEIAATALGCFDGDVKVYDVAVSGTAAPRLSERTATPARPGAAKTPARAPLGGTPSPGAAATESESEAREGASDRQPRRAPARGRGRDSDESARGAETEPRSAPSGGPDRGEERVAADSADSEEGENGERQGGRRRRRGRGRRGRGPSERTETAQASEESVEGSSDTRPKFLELSAFDLDDSSGGDDGGEESRRGGRRRRSRGRGRARRDGTAAEDEPEPAGSRDSEPDPELDEDGEAVLELADAPEPDETDSPSYDEDELEEAPLSAADRLRLEREKRRRAVVAAGAPLSEEPEEDSGPAEIEASPLPRGRAAILACADRDSVFSALLLAREVRTIEGIWVYPQDELMRFFRSVATDLRPGSPLFVVGFEPRPSHDVLQAASLYRDRLAWFDHHEWPPEDLHALRGTIGEGMVHLARGAGSSLPAVLSLSSRRSRFSDKLVDLATGRFTQHDWERWGRLWWHRVGEIAAKTGEQRAGLESLLGGRPSDLAKEASRVPAPPVPPEAAFVASQDFRLVHFGDHAMVVAEVPTELDPGLAARILRERYGASLSLVRETGGRTCLLGSDDSRRAIDVGGMADHLAMKFAWVDSLPDADHVARVRIGDLDKSAERLDEVISEIAMGRSILEG